MIVAKNQAGDLFIGFLFSILMMVLAIDGWVTYLGF
jgi:hypothetical protein